jgi:Cof subfamily protein (haloacid dehalogenase superfamily)
LSFDVRLIAADLDGTLIARDNRLSRPVRKAVQRALDAGIWVIAVTGRPWQWTLDIARAHRLLPAAVVSNGAALVDVETGEVQPTGLADGTVRGLMERIRAKVPGVDFAVDGIGFMGAEPRFHDDTYLGDHHTHFGDLSKIVERDVIKLICRVEGMAAVDLAAEIDEDVTEGVAVPYHGAGEWVELLPEGVSKASGLALVCDRLGVHRHEVVAVGDAWNDIPMLEWAGVGVAMGDAAEHVRAAADRVAPSADDDGVAVLIEELLEGA